MPEDEKRDADFVEKSYDDPSPPSEGRPEEDWTPEEERAIV